MSTHLKRNCYVFLIDGARCDVFQELLRAGRLPNIQKWIVEPGSFLPAVTTFPSTTGPAHIPFLTGQFAGTADVLGYRWLDRTLLRAGWLHPFLHRSYNSPGTFLFQRDMNQKCVTLYELFDRPALVFGPVDLCRNKRLPRPFWPRVLGMARGHYGGEWTLIDRLAERAMLSYLDRGCDFIFSVFLGVDENSHLYTPRDERTLRAYERADRAVGRVVDRLKARNELARSLLLVVSDHGQSTTHTHLPIVDRVKARGFRTLYYPRTLQARFDAAVMESGNSMCMLYFINSHPERPTTDEELLRGDRTRDLAEELLHTKGISFLASRGADDRVVLRAPKGTVRFRRVDGHFELEIDGDNFLEPLTQAALSSGTDPAGPPISSGWISDGDLFERTLRTPYPDLFAQYWALFSSRRCGDLVLSAEPGFDLRLQHEHPEHKAGHGSIHWEHMMTPFAINVPLERTTPIRTVDVFSLVCRLTGKILPPGIEVDARPIH